MKNIIKAIAEGEVLSLRESIHLMDAILNDELSPEQIGFILASFEFRTPTGTELAGFAESLLKKSLALESSSETIIDVCGTGGDGLGMFNVSTCVAFVAAGAGLKVAKHGNRAVSSRCGSFDVLEALDVPFSRSSEEAQYALDKKNLAFLFAPSFHPVLGKLSHIRRNIGRRTVLNALGPLLNPARVRRQIIGVYSPRLLVPMAQALNHLGHEEAMIVHGEDGSDEISLTAMTDVAHLKHGSISRYRIDPLKLGFEIPRKEDLQGGEALENADILLQILRGKRGPQRDITVLNAGAAILVAGKVSSLEEGIKKAELAIDSGMALEMLTLQQEEKKRLVV